MPDTILNVKAFLATARTQSFSEAARQIGTATSVVTKRVSQLEWALKGKLLKRSARGVALTELGERYYEQLRSIVRDFEDIVDGATRQTTGIEGLVRLKTPTALTLLHLGDVLAAFQKQYPGITLDLFVADRSVNPIEEGFDISVGILPVAYDGVLDEVIAPYPRFLCAAPDYLARRGTPKHPNDLINHDCIAFTPVGTTWTFAAPKGNFGVNIHPKLKTNDSFALMNAVTAGVGIGVASALVARDAMRAGRIVPVLLDYPMPPLTLHAMVPQNRARLARVQAVLDCLRNAFQPTPPWDTQFVAPARTAARGKRPKK